jgi:L-fuconate dehydratase
MADYIAISTRMDDRRLEFVDHLHEHFRDPVRIRAGRYLAPQAPGFSAEMHPQSLQQYQFPTGAAWRE